MLEKHIHFFLMTIKKLIKLMKQTNKTIKNNKRPIKTAIALSSLIKKKLNY